MAWSAERVGPCNIQKRHTRRITRSINVCTVGDAFAFAYGATLGLLETA